MKLNRVYFKKNLELHVWGCYEGNGYLTGGGGGGLKDFLPAYKGQNNGGVGGENWRKARQTRFCVRELGGVPQNNLNLEALKF
jgi:hypothetical protein